MFSDGKELKKMKGFVSKNRVFVYSLLSFLLLVSVISLLKAISLGDRSGMMVTSPVSQYVAQQRGALSGEDLGLFREKARKLPSNPVSATAVCGETNQAIISGQVTNCNTPVFSWGKISGAIGYFVYWYQETDQDPQRVMSGKKLESVHTRDPIVVTENKFSPLPGQIERGKRYKLLVQTVTSAIGDSMAGGEVSDESTGVIKDANVLFNYFFYQ